MSTRGLARLLLVATVMAYSTPAVSPSAARSSPSTAASAALPTPARGAEEIREGTLEVSKGNPAIRGALLPHDLVKRAFGRDWRRVALGKRVRVRGVLRIHVCGPQEQCLTSGEIPLFDATSIELVDATQ